MVWRILLLIAAAITFLPETSIAVGADRGCTQVEINSGTCSVSGTITGDSAVLNGNTGTGGASGSGGATDSGGGSSGSGTPGSPCVVIVSGRCLYAVDHSVAVAPVTLADIAAFRPDPGVDHMEPNGWMIVGLDTNFFATGGVQVKDGTLLGQPASVRFTPVTWRWTYGDGTSASAAMGGTTWAAQGVREFDPTPTSHVYRSPGTYYIDLSIDYRAEYRFAGTTWIGISGILSLPANRLEATAGGAKTVLVERECTRNPDGPGC